MSPTAALQSAIEKLGSQEALARLIGVQQSHVSYWLTKARRGVPGEYVLAIEAASGVSRHQLRPDLYPQEASAA